MKVTGTYQISSSTLQPCPPMPVLHTPARKVKNNTKHREWRVNPMVRLKTQQQQLGMPKVTQTYPIAKVRPLQHRNKRTTPQQNFDRTSRSPTRFKAPLPRERSTFEKGSASAQGDVTVRQNGEQQDTTDHNKLQFFMSPSQQNIQGTALSRNKFDGIRKTQYVSLNNKFSNLTMALNTAYKKSQEQAEKRLEMERTLQEKSSQLMSC